MIKSEVHEAMELTMLVMGEVRAELVDSGTSLSCRRVDRLVDHLGLLCPWEYRRESVLSHGRGVIDRWWETVGLFLPRRAWTGAGRSGVSSFAGMRGWIADVAGVIDEATAGEHPGTGDAIRERMFCWSEARFSVNVLTPQEMMELDRRQAVQSKRDPHERSRGWRGRGNGARAPGDWSRVEAALEADWRYRAANRCTAYKAALVWICTSRKMLEM